MPVDPPLSLSDNSFPKAQKLKSKILLQAIFKSGKGKSFYPIRFICLLHDEPTASPLQVCVSVPKRKFPKATDRNRIKRQVRELYRLRKAALLAELTRRQQGMAVMLIFIDHKPHAYQAMESKMDKGLQWLLDQLAAHSD